MPQREEGFIRGHGPDPQQTTGRSPRHPVQAVVSSDWLRRLLIRKWRATGGPSTRTLQPELGLLIRHPWSPIRPAVSAVKNGNTTHVHTPTPPHPPPPRPVAACSRPSKHLNPPFVAMCRHAAQKAMPLTHLSICDFYTTLASLNFCSTQIVVVSPHPIHCKTFSANHENISTCFRADPTLVI